MVGRGGNEHAGLDGADGADGPAAIVPLRPDRLATRCDEPSRLARRAAAGGGTNAPESLPAELQATLGAVLLEQIRRVYSHPQALAQCAASLHRRLPQAELVEVFDTAGAARQIAQDKLVGVAAVASVRAAELYGLAVLAENVESERANATRFLLIAPADVTQERGEEMKTTLALTPRPSVPNALFRSLTAFVGRRLRVWKVEPRPLVGKPGAYRYLVDVEGDAEADPLKAALADLPALNDEVRVLGSYPAGCV